MSLLQQILKEHLMAEGQVRCPEDLFTMIRIPKQAQGSYKPLSLSLIFATQNFSMKPRIYLGSLFVMQDIFPTTVTYSAYSYKQEQCIFNTGIFEGFHYTSNKNFLDLNIFVQPSAKWASLLLSSPYLPPTVVESILTDFCVTGILWGFNRTV